MPESASAQQDGIDVVDIEIVPDTVGRSMAEDEEAGVSQAAPVGFFDDAPTTNQAVSRAIAAQEDLAVRTQTLANRAPDLLARIGNLRGDSDQDPPAAPSVVSRAPEQTPQRTAAPPQPEPPVVQPEPVAVRPEPVVVQPEPPAVQPEPQPTVISLDPDKAVDRLRALATMLDEGLIDRGEFDAKKALILDAL